MHNFDHDYLYELVTEWVRDEGDEVLYQAQDVDSMAGSGYTVAYAWHDHFWVYDDAWGWAGPYDDFEGVLDYFSLFVQAPSSGGHTTLGGSRLKDVLTKVTADFDEGVPTVVTVANERWTLTRGPGNTVVWHPPEEGTALNLLPKRRKAKAKARAKGKAKRSAMRKPSKQGQGRK
jgi:hypothetical protein